MARLPVLVDATLCEHSNRWGGEKRGKWAATSCLSKPVTWHRSRCPITMKWLEEHCGSWFDQPT
jgi:hypothetical protein